MYNFLLVFYSSLRYRRYRCRSGWTRPPCVAVSLGRTHSCCRTVSSTAGCMSKLPWGRDLELGSLSPTESESRTAPRSVHPLLQGCGGVFHRQPVVGRLRERQQLFAHVLAARVAQRRTVDPGRRRRVRRLRRRRRREFADLGCRRRLTGDLGCSDRVRRLRRRFGERRHQI